MPRGKDGAPVHGAPSGIIRSGNRVLDSLGDADLRLVLPELEPMALLAGQILGQTGGAMPWVIFPRESAVVSLVAVDHGGRTAESVSIGSDGLVGPELVALPGFGHLQVQMPGPGYRIGSAALAALAGACPALRDAVSLHGHALLVQALQASVCAALHPVEARVSRWLLLAQDRTGQPDLPVTQELLAEMLGVRRTTITRVIAQLGERGLIRHRRSRVTITDRPGLETAACGCHAALRLRLRHVAPGLYPPA